MWAVYGLYHAKTGKWYVGASKNVDKRLERHGIYRKIPKEDLMPKILEEVELGN